MNEFTTDSGRQNRANSPTNASPVIRRARRTANSLRGGETHTSAPQHKVPIWRSANSAPSEAARLGSSTKSVIYPSAKPLSETPREQTDFEPHCYSQINLPAICPSQGGCSALRPDIATRERGNGTTTVQATLPAKQPRRYTGADKWQTTQGALNGDGASWLSLEGYRA